MSYDLLIIASDACSTSNFSHMDFQGLADKWGMTLDEWNRMIDARPPRWTVNDTEMIFPAQDLYFRNGRQLQISEAERRAYYESRGSQELKYLNGIALADFTTRHGYSVEVINTLAPDFHNLEHYLQMGPRAVAISTTFIPNRRRVEEIAAWIKQRDPSIHVIVGGPLVRFSHMIHEQKPDIADLPLIDGLYFFQKNEPHPNPSIDALVVDARGEQTLIKILDHIKKGQDYQQLANVAYYGSDHRLTVNPLEPEQMGVEEWEIDWENLPERFLGPVVAVRGSLGCPLRCKFCSFVVLYPEWELKSVDFMERELQKIASRSFIKSICFVDDNLFLRRDQVDRYSRMMAKAKLPFSWSGFIRVDSVTEENVDWIAESKCAGMMLGIESGDPTVLKNMRKVQRPERVLNNIGLVNNRGITTHSSFIVGFPGETEETVGNTIELLNNFEDSGPGFNWFNAWINAILPLTPVDKEGEKWGVEGYLCDWKHDTMTVAEAGEQIKRIYREVTKGAYVGYLFDDMGRFAYPGGHQDNLEAMRLRQALAVMDEDGLESFNGVTRQEALDQLEHLVIHKPDQIAVETETEEPAEKEINPLLSGSTDR
ncbi:MAG: radical SAM protein [Planctomycetota bacterium]